MEQWGLPDLPHKVIYNILSRLPVKSLCRFKSVSKPWLALINDPHFIKSHLHQSMQSNTNQKLIVVPQYNRGHKSPISFYSMDYQAPDPTIAKLEMPWKYCDVDIWGSFNGVLLVGIDEELRLWNPSIGMYQKISPLRSSSCFQTVYGLAYDSINDDFKVVGVVKRDVPSMPPPVHVFSSKLSSWKSIGDFDYHCGLYNGTPRCVLNGSPHWVTSSYPHKDRHNFHIVCFDVMEEKFKDVPMPTYEVGCDFFNLGVLDGCLCVVDCRHHFDIWVMKEYGVKESWAKLFVVPNVPRNVPGALFSEYYQLLCFAKDGEVVLRLQLEKKKKLEESLKLVIYNPKQKTKRIGMPQDWQLFGVTVYVESLVSPHGCNSTRRHC
ncbi:F-box protein CPR1-like [Rhododendron vialii]|uniref:F-box protein CPR1-like n=1 Tax=Rhododendron vialii TaxID=182163 RepID=UPI00265EC1A1|nr:F-box protein CPR1-like [Rhododendron vialii]XP_058213034.1 F-box protein CPR1-like [Rhododendron vialii]